ncbi:response regulator [Algicella marina]|uniref:Response regulator n=1 Tax=Algicella marina TaxID=2683284 RepID=A0A6P1T1F3_9RHOB|nr:response regulator [Algicella marina]QHQ35473.1 response regulator [Algicella marina]
MTKRLAAAVPQQATDHQADPCILILEDDRKDRQLLQRLILSVESNARIYCAETISAAKQLASEHFFDAVVFDYSLPDGFGTAFAADLRKSDQENRILLFLISGWPSSFLSIEARKAQIDKTFFKQEFGLRQVALMIRAIRMRHKLLAKSQVSAEILTFPNQRHD